MASEVYPPEDSSLFTCQKCGRTNLTKDEVVFNPSGLTIRACKICRYAYVNNCKKAIKGRTNNYNRRSNLKQKYDLNLETYDAMIKLFGNMCMICRKSPIGRGGKDRLVVDHDHETNEFRGLLCGWCNSAIGFL
jgi:Recombination endonuclease VII